MTLLAWHGDPALKAEVLERMRAHRAHDEIVQGLYQQIDPDVASGYRGCLIGCTLPLQTTPYSSGGWVEPPAAGWHETVEEMYGIPTAVAHMLDRVFEMSHFDAAADFAVASIEAIPVGADLTLVASRVVLDALTDTGDDAPRVGYGQGDLAAVDEVAGLYRRRLAGDEPARVCWEQNCSAGAPDLAFDAATVARFDELSHQASNFLADNCGEASWARVRLLHHLRTATPVATVTTTVDGA